MGGGAANSQYGIAQSQNGGNSNYRAFSREIDEMFEAADMKT